MYQRPKCESQNIKHLEEKGKKNLQKLGVGKNILDTTPKKYEP